MNPNDRRLRLDLAAARYLEAIERDDFDTQIELWRVAESDPELAAAFHEIHAGLIEEQQAATTAAVQAVAEKHLTSGEVFRPAGGPVTVAEVADELFRHTPDRLPADAHSLNERLRTVTEPLPTDLGLTGLVAWAEAKFGAAAAPYWKAFYAALVKLDLRRASETEYQLAARAAPKPEGER
jgi:hypothetical protein